MDLKNDKAQKRWAVARLIINQSQYLFDSTFSQS